MRSLPMYTRRLSFAVLLSVSGCACAVGEPTEQGMDAAMDTSMPDTSMPDTSIPDTSMPDTSMPDTSMPDTSVPDASDAGFVYDGAVPTVGVVIFTEINLGGQAQHLMADSPNLGATFNNAVSSVVLASGYTLYGTSSANYGGDLSDPIIGPMTINDLGVLADTWDAIIVRPSSEPTAVVYRDVGTNPKTYPLGMFPSLGASTDVIDGVNLPDGVSLVGYDDPSFGGAMRGPYVGPLVANALPFRDEWSSLEIRATTANDIATGQVIFYEHQNQNMTQAGQSVLLTLGSYANLDELPGTNINYNNLITSIRGRTGLAVFGFAWASFGGDSYGPYIGDTSPVAGNDNWDSIVIQPVTAPTVVLYFSSDTGSNFNTYPLIDVPNLQNRSNDAERVFVPAGYVVQGFSHSDYGGTTYTHAGPGTFNTQSNEWDSFRVRQSTAPTVTFYFAPTKGDPRVYGLGSYPRLQTVANQIEGANIPCGVRVRGFDSDNFGGTTWMHTGPTDIQAVGGVDQWNSMVVELVPGAVCP